MKKAPVITALFACFCFNSCVTWDIGGCIRHAGDKYQGLDLGPDDSPLPVGAPAPEVTYRLNRPLVTSSGFIGGKVHTPTAEDVQATGHTAPVPKPHYKSYDTVVLSADKHRIRQTGVIKSPCVSNRILAAPFDIVVDPALTILSSPFVYFFQK